MSIEPVGRETTARKFLQVFYPNHYVIWIDSHHDYKIINLRLQEKEKNDVIILQTEEDSFRYLDIELLRQTIADDKHWTDNSFLITNSKQDYELSKNYIKTVWRPGILDLISYARYDKSIITPSIDKIQFHTGFLYQGLSPLRQMMFKICDHFITKNSILSYNNARINNMNDDTCVFPASSSITAFNAPYVDIEYDRSWTKQSAFIISLETYNHGTLSSATDKHFAPTLSEKTYKAMHLMRPALIFGGPGTRDYLKHFGFDTWDWFIDWSFENYTDPNDYLKYYLREIKRLLDTDINELKNLLEKNKDALEHNKNQVFKCLAEYNKI